MADIEGGQPHPSRFFSMRTLYATKRGRQSMAAATFVLLACLGITAVVLSQEAEQSRENERVELQAEGAATTLAGVEGRISSSMLTIASLAPIVNVVGCTGPDDLCLMGDYFNWIFDRVSDNQPIFDSSVLVDSTFAVIEKYDYQPQPWQDSIAMGDNMMVRYEGPILRWTTNLIAGKGYVLYHYDADYHVLLSFAPVVVDLSADPDNPFPTGTGDIAPGNLLDATPETIERALRQGGNTKLYLLIVESEPHFFPATMMERHGNDISFRVLLQNTVGDDTPLEVLSNVDGDPHNPVVFTHSTPGVDWVVEVQRDDVGVGGTIGGFIVVVILLTFAGTALVYWALQSHNNSKELAVRNNQLEALMGILEKRVARSDVLGRIGMMVTERESDRTILDVLQDTCRTVVDLVEPLAVTIVTMDGRSTTIAVEEHRCDRTEDERTNLDDLVADKSVQKLVRSKMGRFAGTHGQTSIFSGGSSGRRSSSAVSRLLTETTQVGLRVGSVRSLSGDEGVVEVIASPIQGVGDVWGSIMCVNSDKFDESDAAFLDELALMLSHAITRAEHEKSKMDFLSMMSHEMYTPLHGIFGSVELLNDSEPKLNETQLGFTESIAEATDRMFKLVGSMLTYAELGSGRVQLDTKWVDPVDVGDLACTLVASEARKKGLELACVAKGDVEMAKLDAHRVQQVLVQMLLNGIKFTDKGSVVVEVAQIEDHAVEFAVVDTGCGISDENIETLFDTFGQADASITRQKGGTGMGLAVSKETVELMDGTITVTSKLGEGTRFAFALASDHIRAEDSEKELTLKPSVPRVSTPHTVAVVGGSALERTMLERAFTRSGHTVRMCDDAAAAAGADVAVALGSGATAVPGVPTATDVVVPMRVSSLQDALARAISARATATVEAAAGGDPERRLRVLACEDDKLNRRLLKLFLRKLNCDVVFAEDGQYGVDAFRDKEAPFDIVFMDLHMPRKSGYDATKEIRAMDASVPIVALTADHTAGVEDACLAAGMQAMVNKPFKKNDVAGALERFVR